MQSIVKLREVCKLYPSLTKPTDRLSALWAILRDQHLKSAHHILSSIDLEVLKGESLGLVGVNGAGKSTLLKTIAGVISPSSGTVEVNGRLAALLELGAGFHPEYTGLENIKLSAALLGIHGDYLKEKIPAMVEFADIGDYIHEPVKHYSSGMVVRLGFAVITAANPDLLITDEVLAVGDESFQKKCIRWIEDYLSNGGTLLLCSHGMFHIQKLCKKAAWIHEGRLHRYGNAFDVTQEYLAWHNQKTVPYKTEVTHKNSGEYRITEFWAESDIGERITELATGQALVLKGLVESADGRTPIVCVGIVRTPDVAVYGLTSDMDEFELRPAGSNLFEFTLEFHRLPMLPGRYILRAHAMDPEGIRLFDTVEHTLTVSGTTRELGMCRLEHSWS